MAINQRRIVNRDSFVDATAPPRSTAALYFHKQVDSFYDVALTVSRDFFARPQMYTRVEAGDGNGGAVDAEVAEKTGPGVIEIMARLRSRVGTDELLPSAVQR